MSRLLIVALTTIIVTLASSGCESKSSLVGTYDNVTKKGEYLELRQDGTFFSKEGAGGFSGNYRVDGDTITLTLQMGTAARGKIEKGDLVTEDGRRYVKRK